jgi:hypothetical protein
MLLFGLFGVTVAFGLLFLAVPVAAIAGLMGWRAAIRERGAAK